VIKKLNSLMEDSKKENGIIINFAKDFNSEEEMQHFYLEYGFVCLKQFIPKDLIENIVEDLKFIFSPYSTDNLNPIDSGILNLDKADKKLLHKLHLSLQKSTAVRSMPNIFRNIISSINEDKTPVLDIFSGLLLGISKDDRLVYNFHQESNYYREAFSDITVVHYPLLRTSKPENGTMSILPGSHKLGTLDYDKSQKSNNSYTTLIPKNMSKIVDKFPEFHCYLEVGDVILLNKDLIHKSNYNSSELCRIVASHRLTQSISGEWEMLTAEDL
tara:strand:+ start:1292 stop:2107 length:816 start_codon:yes stop_codon:yes gene_type:complete